ncbi:MAG: hypothetical protein JRD02_06560 [Deltaproteobacteria bacterium]|nr:hypothetical protein [Deltaproteobacteria bacterium]
MKNKLLVFAIGGLLLATFLSLPPHSFGEGAKTITIDKALCAKMVRSGQELCERGRHKEAREAFRKAIQANPYSARAWHFYDICFVFSWALELKNRPAPPPEATTSDVKGATPAAPVPKPEEEDDEGC